jgi:DNA-binding NarL/FixJ family response regulator
VVLLSGLGLSEGALLEILQALDGGLSEPVWVVWADFRHRDWVADALNRGVRAVLPLDASAGEIIAAIGAAAMGLVVLAPEWVEDVFAPSSRTSIVPGVPFQALTEREVEVLEMLALGLGNKAIAARLGISEHTVKFHLSSIFTKLDASSRTQAVAMGVRLGLILTMKLSLFLLLAILNLCCLRVAAQIPDFLQSESPETPTPNLQEIPEVFVEGFGGSPSNFRFKIRNVNINNQGNVITVSRGGEFPVSMDILHDCTLCGNAINQVIVGIGGEERAQISVWNGKQRSGGPVMVVNRGTPVQALAEDNPGSAEWVTVYFNISVPDQPGIYYLRTRYAQDYQGNLFTAAGREYEQEIFQKVLDWWKVDRPNGPEPESNIGAIIVQ